MTNNLPASDRTLDELLRLHSEMGRTIEVSSASLLRIERVLTEHALKKGPRRSSSQRESSERSTRRARSSDSASASRR